MHRMPWKLIFSLTAKENQENHLSKEVVVHIITENQHFRKNICENNILDYTTSVLDSFQKCPYVALHEIKTTKKKKN